MTSLLSVHDFKFGAKGPALSFALRPGQIFVVYGPSGSGKTRFLRCLCGLERNYKGSIRLGAEIAFAGYPEPSRRSTPESLARRVAGRSAATRTAEALAATHLWESRRIALAHLTPGQQAASELIQALASSAKLLFIDGQLDRLDSRSLRSVLDLLGQRISTGASVCLATNSPSLASRSDLLVIWKEGSLAFAGAYQELERKKGWTQFEIETLHDPAVRALCDPFEVSIQSADGALKMRAKEGQALAARMLLEGYGDVKAVIERPPTPDEVLDHV